MKLHSSEPEYGKYISRALREAGSPHPFASIGETYHCAAADRLSIIRGLRAAGDLDGLRRILWDPVGTPLQGSVRKAAEAAIRAVGKKISRPSRSRRHP